MSSPSPREVFLRLVQGVSEGKAASLPALYAEPTDVRHPMWPGGLPPLTTRDELARHFGVGMEAVAPVVRFRAEAIVVHETTDPEVIVAEFEYRGTVIATGEPFAVPCVFVMRIRDGLIVESRDYIDHLAFAKARGQLDTLVEALRPSAT